MSRKQVNDEFIRRRIERQRRIRKRRLIIFLIFLIILLIITGAILCLTVFFPISAINVKGSAVYTEAEIQKASGVDIGDNIFVLSETGIENQLRKELPYIESIKLKRKLPDKINITVKDAEEYAVYEYEGKYYTVGFDGWVLKCTAEVNENVALISGAKVKGEVGSKIIFEEERQQEFINQIKDALNQKSITVDYIDIRDFTSLKIGIEGRFAVELGTSNDVEEKINHLFGMIQKIDNTKTGKINLSMWQKGETKGTFVEGKLENFVE